MKKVLLFTVAFSIALLLSNTVFSQGVAINTDGTSADGSAMLDIKSTTSGLLIPRMNLVQRGLITSPATGLMIFQTDNTPGYYFYNGAGWQRLGTGNIESLTFASPLSSTGGSNPTVYISQSGAVGGQTLEWNGSAWAPANDDNTTYSAGTGLTLTGTVFTPTFGTGVGTVAQGNHGHTNMVTASGTTNYVSKFTSANTLGNSLLYDDGTNVGIGMTPGTYKLDINGNLRTTMVFDANDVSFYLDPTSISSLNDVRGNIFYDRGNTTFYVDPASTSILNDVRASIFYDRDNTSYYVDPASTTRLVNLNIVNSLILNGSTGTPGQVLTTNGATPYWAIPVTSATAWQLTGNSSTNSTTNFLGTLDAVDFVIRTTNTERMRILSGGNVGIGTNSPSFTLHVNGSAGASILYDQNNTSYYIDPASTSITNDMRANIFYDNGNTGFYVDPASTSNLATVYSGLEYSTMFYDRDNTGYYLDPASTSQLNDVRASIFYDRDNTTYYVNPASSSYLSSLYIASLGGGGSRIVMTDNTGFLYPASAASVGLVSGSGTTNYISKFTSASTLGNSVLYDDGINVGIGMVPGTFRLDINGNLRTTMVFDANDVNYYLDPSSVSSLNEVRGNIFYDRANTSYYIDPASTSITNDMRANIFYDYGNTGFYVDPASSSILNDVRASVFYDRDNTSYYLDPASSSNLNVLNTIGTTRIGTLSGTGTRIVLADATGILSANTAAGAGLVSGTGTTNYVTKWTGTSTQGNSQIFDNGTNVGIGTNSPSAGLHMYQDRYTLYGPNSGWGAYLQVGGNGRVTTYASVAATNGNLHLDAANGAFATYINYYSQNNTYINGAGGNVGIGTTAPLSKLHVDGGNLTLSQTAGQTGFTLLSYNNATSLWLISPTTSSKIVFGVAHDWDRQVSLTYTPGTTGAAGGDLVIGQVDKNAATWTHGVTRFLTNGSERMRIDASGNVGIGTTTPSFKLHVPSGYIGTDYINTTDNVVGSGVTGIMVKTGDNYHRTASAAAVCAFLNNGTFIPNNGIGDWQIASSSTGTAYNVASLELRESNFTGTGAATPPRLGFHWGGVVASQIGIESSGRIAILNNPGTGYENLIANNIYSAANLYFTTANPTISASSYFIAPGGAYFNSGTVYFQSQIQARGGIHDDTNANLTIAGGTAGTTAFSGSISGMSGYSPANNMIRLTPNLHLNSLAGNAVILNWDNGTTGNTQTLRIGNGAGTDVFNVWASGNTSIGTTPSTLYKLYTLATQLTASGDGQASIYGYRTRDSQNDGTGYYAYSSNNAITGYNYWGDLYTFGVFGHSDGDYTRTGGTIGETGGTWGSLGYKGSNSVYYGVYGSNAYSSGGGFMEDGNLSGVGIAGFGQLMGGWSRGELMGFTTSGEMYALYNDGNSYTEGYSADIVKTDDGRKAAYSVTSTELKVYDDGSYEINGNEIFVSFDKDFASMINPTQNPTITVSPVGGWAPLYIKEIRQDGFVVANDNYNGNNVKFSWIAVAERIDSENAELPKDIADDKFNENLKGFMFNENITNRNATPMWWDGSTLRFDAIPEKPIDEAAKKAEEERIKQ